jgi:hypothetical protein
MLVGRGVRALKIPPGLTIRVTSNAREKTTKILAYRQGGFNRAYKAVLPMCTDDVCRRSGPHTLRSGKVEHPLYHRRDVDNFVVKLIKSYC